MIYAFLHTAHVQCINIPTQPINNKDYTVTHKATTNITI
jgi:hypothetical protein